MEDKVLYRDDSFIIEVDVYSEDENIYSIWFMEKGIQLILCQEEWDGFCDAMQLVIGED